MNRKSNKVIWKYRNKEIKKRLITLLFYYFIIFITSVYGSAGNTGAEFLLIDVSAKTASMGSAHVAVAGNINAVSWNPAGLSLIKGKEISTTYAKWLSDIRWEFIGYGHSTEKFGTFGISAIYLHMDDIEGRSLNGKKADDFSAYDLSANFSYGNKISKNISLGTSVKFIKQSIEDETANGIAFDLGGLYEISNTNLILGGALLNLGPKMKFVKEEYSMPLTLNFGIGYKFNLAVFALEIKHRLNDKFTSLSIGTEYCLREFFALRGGYLLKNKNQNEVYDGLGAGLGFKLNKYQLDYAFVPFANLGNTHRISFTGKF